MEQKQDKRNNEMKGIRLEKRPQLMHFYFYGQFPFRMPGNVRGNPTTQRRHGQNSVKFYEELDEAMQY